MEHKVSRLKTVTVVLKILTGLGQVVSKQEEVMEQKLPGPQWDSDFLNVMKFDIILIVPICEVDYTKRFLLNSVALPLSLMLLVAATWATFTPKDEKESKQATYFRLAAIPGRFGFHFARFWAGLRYVWHQRSSLVHSSFV